ncbi:MAG: hypothetical protein LBG11_05195 [Bifidobacteriaceae bacterium]|nr:hypothetical protein [Bifidobacteriaceae bacterium]
MSNLLRCLGYRQTSAGLGRAEPDWNAGLVTIEVAGFTPMVAARSLGDRNLDK